MKHINVGVLANTHGLKGDVKIKMLTDFPQERFKKNAAIYFMEDHEEKELIVVNARVQKDMMVVTFKGYDHINKIEHLKGTRLYIHEDQQHVLSDDEAYYHEMMDSDVYTMEEVYVGKVIEVIETGANAVLRVENGEHQILIPFVKAFVKAFDKQHKIMHVEEMDGL